MMRTWFVRVAGLSAALLLFVSGCGDNKTVVEGMVTIRGSKINNGLLKFQDKAGKVLTTGVNPDGSFKLDDSSTGELRVTIEADPLAANLVGADQPSPAPKGLQIPDGSGKGLAGGPPQFVTIDSRYAIAANGVTIMVRGGQQKIDIDFR